MRRLLPFSTVISRVPVLRNERVSPLVSAPSKRTFLSASGTILIRVESVALKVSVCELSVGAFPAGWAVVWLETAGAGLPPVRGDAGLLRDVLQNLLDNAAKYSSPGSSITIAGQEEPAEILLSVHNQGSFIPPEEREKIFERFYRGKQTQESVGGTGMGLSIARDIVRAHKGKLRVQNTPEGGAQFSFTLAAFHEVQLS